MFTFDDINRVIFIWLIHEINSKITFFCNCITFEKRMAHIDMIKRRHNTSVYITHYITYIRIQFLCSYTKTIISEIGQPWHSEWHILSNAHRNNCSGKTPSGVHAISSFAEYQIILWYSPLVLSLKTELVSSQGKNLLSLQSAHRPWKSHSAGQLTETFGIESDGMFFGHQVTDTDCPETDSMK